MTVSNVESTAIRIGDGVAVDFDFTIEAVDAASIQVGYISGLTVVLADPADYTVSMNTELTGGTVSFNVAPLLGTKIYIFRETTRTQVVSVSRQQGYDPSVVERVWDKLTFMVQELAAEVTRAVKTSPDADPATLIADLENARQDAVDALAAAVIARDIAVQAAIDAGAFAASINPTLFALKGSASTITADWQITGTFNFGALNESSIVYNAGLKIDGDLVTIRSKTGLKKMFEGVVDAAVSLFYNNAKKLETTNTGVTVTGAVSADTVAGNWIASQAEAEAGASTTKVMNPLRVLQAIVANKIRQRTGAAGTVTATATYLITDIPQSRPFILVLTDVLCSLGTAQNLRIRCSTDGGSTWLSTHINISASAIWNATGVSAELEFIPGGLFGYIAGIRGPTGVGQQTFLPKSLWQVSGNNVYSSLVNAIELSFTGGNLAGGGWRVLEL